MYALSPKILSDPTSTIVDGDNCLARTWQWITSNMDCLIECINNIFNFVFCITISDLPATSPSWEGRITLEPSGELADSGAASSPLSTSFDLIATPVVAPITIDVADSLQPIIQDDTQTDIPFIIFGAESQLDIELSPEEVLRNVLRSNLPNGEMISKEALIKHYDIASTQKHSCGSSCLESILYTLSDSEKEEFSEDDIHVILSRGIAQYHVSRNDLDDKQKSEDETERLIAEAQAGVDGITLDGISAYYIEKGLTAIKIFQSALVNEENEQAVLNDLLSRLELNQGMILNISGKFISITCKADEENNKYYALFDPHPSNPDDSGIHQSAMMTNFVSADDIILAFESRYKVIKEMLLEYNIFLFDPAVYSAYSERVAANIDTVAALDEERGQGLRDIIEAMIIVKKEERVALEEASLKLVMELTSS